MGRCDWAQIPWLKIDCGWCPKGLCVSSMESGKKFMAKRKGADVAPHRIALSLFSGAGGDTKGLEAAGWKVTHFSEFNPTAIRTHETAFPGSKLLVGSDGSNDIKKIPDATFQALRGTVGAIFAGHPCFRKGTNVLTNRGYLPIEEVSLDDTLLTHTGIFQSIINLQRKLYTGTLYKIRAKYHPVPLVATEEHPFYVRERCSNGRFEPPVWKKACNLTPTDYFGMPINTNNKIPEFTIKKGINSDKEVDIHLHLDNPDQWFMMGYFLGDGWIQDTLKKDGVNFRHVIRFTIANRDKETVLKRLQKVLPLTLKSQANGCCTTGCGNLEWWTILKDFGKYAHGKRIPEWVQDAPKELIQEFLAGYAAADGNTKRNSMKYTTVSPSIAFGIQRLYLKLGKFASIQKTVRPPTCVIEGRTVNQRDTYDIVSSNSEHRYTSFIEDNYAWFAPFKLETTEVIDEPVYNFEVANDNSYCVENIIVHNCQGFSHAGKKRTDDPRNELVHEFVRAARLAQPEWIIGENVKGLLARKGVYPEGTAARPVIDIIRGLFEEIGYKMTYRVFDATEVGVPQLRKRLIYIGHRGDLYPHIPWDSLVAPSPPPSIRGILEATLEGAVRLPDLYKPAEQPARFWIQTTETEPTGTPHPNLVRLVEGKRSLSTKEKRDKKLDKKAKVLYTEPAGLISFGVRKGCYHGQVLDPDAPSKTIICAYNQCPRLFVGLHNPATGAYWVRCLTVRECGQIQGFPADYPWQGATKDKITQIGNAVPPPLATAVAGLLERATFAAEPQAVGAVGATGSDSESEEE